jgi:hypothetical protein
LIAAFALASRSATGLRLFGQLRVGHVERFNREKPQPFPLGVGEAKAIPKSPSRRGALVERKRMHMAH